MLGFRYMKSAPTTYIRHDPRGNLIRQGAGLSFCYFAPTSVISWVSVTDTSVRLWSKRVRTIYAKRVLLAVSP